MSVFIIGDSHLTKVVDIANLDGKSLNFDEENANIYWLSGTDLLKNIQPAYNDQKLKVGTPKAIILLCGGYELRLNNKPKEVVKSIVGLTKFFINSSIKYVYVCAILDRYDKNDESLSKASTSTNRILAKSFKKMDNIHLINIRPIGKSRDFIIQDTYSLTTAGYKHVFSRIRTCVCDNILLDLQQSFANVLDLLSEVPKATAKKIQHIDFEQAKYSEENTTHQRIKEFQQVLKEDYAKVVEKETAQVKIHKDSTEILDVIRAEKEKVMKFYQKLFGTSITTPTEN